MNFSQFTKQNHDKNNTTNKLTEQDIKKSYEELKDLNSDQLLNRLNDEVKKQKDNGTFNYDLIVSSIECIKSLIPEKSYNELKGIVESLK